LALDFSRDPIDEFLWKLRQRYTGAHNSWVSGTGKRGCVTLTRSCSATFGSLQVLIDPEKRSVAVFI
jgi:hypothetical protein